MLKPLPLAIFCAAAVVLGVAVFGLEKKEKAPELNFSFTVLSDPSIISPHRIGLNLGQWTSWGSQQYQTNVLLNPGFEGQIDRIIITVSAANSTSFSDELGLGYPDHTWNEAAYEVRTGRSAGKQGSIKYSLNSGKGGLPQYVANNDLPLLEANDIIALTKIRRPDPPDFWVTETPSRVAIDHATVRTGSAGSQSLKLSSSSGQKAEISSYLDTISDRAGKLLTIEKGWKFSVWAKALKPGGELKATLIRINPSTTLFSKTFDLTTDWQEFNFEFEGKDIGPAGSLKFSLTTSEAGNTVWLDDVFLGPRQGQTFRKEIISALKELNPSYLREFPPIGDAWENRIASPAERKTWLLRESHSRSEPIFEYSLPEFFDLCRLINAKPWLVLPPVFSDYECRQYGTYLSKASFPELIIEFGQANWNWNYRPQSIPHALEQGKASKRDFELISPALGKDVNARFLVNGEHNVSEAVTQFLDHAPHAHGLSIAPYFLYTLNKGIPDEAALILLFQDDEALKQVSQEIRERDLSLAVSEINLHTTQGSARSFERTRLVAGAASGSALAKRLIECMVGGADPIMVHTFAQHDVPAWNVNDFVELWGIVRDFGPPLRLRPTGLAMKLMNQAIQGNLHGIEDSEATDKITIAAFRSENRWTLAAVSELTKDAEIEIEFPDDGVPLPHQESYLHAETPFDTNEEEEKVTIATRSIKVDGRKARFLIPAWGFAILE